MYVPQSSRGGGGSAGEQPRVYQVWRGSNVWNARVVCLLDGVKEFLLQGRFIFGPDVRSLFLTIFLILAPVLVFCIFVARHLMNDFPDHWGISVMVVAVVFTVYDLTLLLLTSGRDPGIVPRNMHPPEPESLDGNNDTGNGQTPQQLRLPRTKDVYVNGVVVKVKYCDTCMLYRPPRCSHCSICNNCVERFDHHCPWVGQCIGLTTYENFRYRYDRRANPYNVGVVNNFLEIFCTAVPASKNNFRARVPVEQGLQQSRPPTRGFMSPNMGKPVGDLELGRKPVSWDEPRSGADIRDLEVGGMLDEKEGRITHASPDLSREALPVELMEGRAGMHSRRSSWGHRSGTSESMDSIAVQMGGGETNWGSVSSGHGTTSGTH
uniref:S-acyltransferase n=1 Tax=Aegilops tauschii TaxID=37682 RepID=M8C6H2_AEGTA